MNTSAQLILYKASAGSGKTYTLAKEYIKIVLLQPYDYRKILAVTFTRKATQEMKSRIIEYLSLLQKKDKTTDSLRKNIIEEILQDKGVDITDVIDKNVQDALQLILHDYSNFNISTIDSFFQGIIRSFAKELDLPVGMEVELDTDFVIQQAVQSILKEYKSEKDTFSKWIEEYVFDLIEEDKSWKIEKNISQLARQLLSEDYQLLVQEEKQVFDIETYKNVLLELKQLIKDYRTKLNALTKEVERKIQQDDVDLTLFFQGKNSVKSFINKTKNYEPAANSYIMKMLSGGEIYSKSKVKDEADKIQIENAWNNYIVYYIQEVLTLKDVCQQKYNSAEIVLKNIYALALLEFINSKIKAYKSDENLILISDTNQIVSLIAKHETVPFIFEKSANFLKYILIDEFQDTSLLQWKGVLPLLLEILQNINGLVLLVGDPKQSIYRWRGGKMELMVDGIAEDMDFHWNNRKDVPLHANYRSANEIVLFNNLFFSTLRDTIEINHPLFKNALSDVEQTVIKTGNTGFVQCKWLEKSDDKEDESNEHLDEVLETINALSNTKKYGDIAILTRTKFQGALIANHLKLHHIPVVSAESLLLSHHLPVKLLIAAVEYVLKPEEVFYAVKLNYLYARFINKENPEAYFIKDTKGNYFFELKFPDLSVKNVAQFISLPVDELVFKLMHLLELDSNKDNYIQRFQDVILQFCIRHSNATADFLEYWTLQKEKLSIVPPEGLDAVKVYTIHKSKGLQFPVVILPFATWNMKPKPTNTIWLKSDEHPFDKLQVFPVETKKNLEESLFSEVYFRELDATYIDNVNLLYVAFTRAEEQLYIFSTQEKKEPKDELVPQNVSRLLKRILKNMALETAELKDMEFTFGAKDSTIKNKNTTSDTRLLKPAKFNLFKDVLHLKQKQYFNDAILKGENIHAILSKIYQPNHLEKAIHSIELTDEEPYRAATKYVTDIFLQKDWFNEKWKHFTERNIYFKQEKLRADRILLSDEECIIIDYKTGAKESEHLQQIRKYKTAYTAVFEKKITSFLIYIDTREILEVK